MRRFGQGARLMLAMLPLAGCAGHKVPRGGETITYATTRCFGACPAYTVTLGPDGQGIFTGEANTVVVGERRFRAAPDQVSAFTVALEKVRPDGERLVQAGKPGCGDAATDMPGADVTWQGAGGAAHLAVYYGCSGKKARRLAAALRAAPDLLPIAEFVGRR